MFLMKATGEELPEQLARALSAIDLSAVAQSVVAAIIIAPVALVAACLILKEKNK